MSTISSLVLLSSLPCALMSQHPPKGQGGCCDHCRSDLQENQARAAARKVAEAHTGGKAVAFTQIRINGSTVWGFEVRVHMPGKDKGWRCLVDMDFPPKVYNKYEISNPPPPKDGPED